MCIVCPCIVLDCYSKVMKQNVNLPDRSITKRLQLRIKKMKKKTLILMLSLGVFMASCGSKESK